MNCPRCGTALERGRVLCPNCKEPVRAAIALTASQTAAAAHDEAVSQPRTMQLPAVKIPIAGVPGGADDVPLAEPPPAESAAPAEESAAPAEATDAAPAPAAEPAARPTSPRPPERPLRAT